MDRAAFVLTLEIVYRHRRTGFVLVLAGLLVTACASSGPAAPSSPTASPTASPRPSPTAAPRIWRIVALGDSVPRGTNCDCAPYPPLTADTLATSGRAVTATNDSVAGSTTSAVLHQLESDHDVIAHVTAADAVEVEVGANDVAHSSTCGTSLDCYTPKIPAIEKNLRSIINRVHQLTAGHPVLVVLLDYWSVWLGGAYATAEGDAYVTTAADLTADVNTAVMSVAASSGSAYVDLRAAFERPDYAYDETHYLSDDGDHPNAAGHQQIAAAAVDVIEATLHI